MSGRGYCSECGGFYVLTKGGAVRQHGRGRGWTYRGCPGGGRWPVRDNAARLALGRRDPGR